MELPPVPSRDLRPLRASAPTQPPLSPQAPAGALRSTMPHRPPPAAPASPVAPQPSPPRTVKASAPTKAKAKVAPAAKSLVMLPQVPARSPEPRRAPLPALPVVSSLPPVVSSLPPPPPRRPSNVRHSRSASDLSLSSGLVMRPPARPTQDRARLKYASFGVTLDSIMAAQRQALPESTLPLVLTTLMHMVVSNGGLRSEGIFRVSGSLGEVQRLKDTLNKGAFDVEFHGDPNTPACALKQWITELQEPVIARPHYERFVQCARSGNASQVVRLVDTLPATNAAVLRALLDLLRNVLQHSDENRMTKSALAIVFAPGLFGSAMGADPLAYLQNSQSEAQCVQALLG